MVNEDLVARLRAVRVKTPEEIMAQYDRKFSEEDILRGRTFFSEAEEGEFHIGVVVALQRALNYIGENGIIATMPELIAARCKDIPSHEFWDDWYTAHSEENIGIDREGRFYGKGEPVLVVVHGGGLLTPTRLWQAYDEGFIHVGTVPYVQEEFDDLLRGELGDGSSINLYSFEEINAGVANLPHQFGVVMPYTLARGTISGPQTKQQFLENPLVIARNAGKENLEKYFELEETRMLVDNVHLYNERDAAQAQGNMLFINPGEDGLVVEGINCLGRFFGVRYDE